MLIDKLPGTPFNPDSATPEQKTKVLGQWTGILCTLGQHSFKKLSSLTFDGVGPVASDRTGRYHPLALSVQQEICTTRGLKHILTSLLTSSSSLSFPWMPISCSIISSQARGMVNGSHNERP